MENKIEWVKEEHKGFEEDGYYLVLFCRNFKVHNAKFVIAQYRGRDFYWDGVNRNVIIIAVLNVNLQDGLNVNLQDGKESFVEITKKFQNLPKTIIETNKHTEKWFKAKYKNCD